MSTDIEYMSTEIRSAREAHTLFKILGIKDITTNRQRKNGTTVYELPMQRAYPGTSYPIRFATYSTGYVRNISKDLSSPYQINKTKKRPAGTDGYHFDTIERILIPKWEDRLIYLAKFIIRNYYNKPVNIISDCSLKYIRQELSKPVDTAPEVQVIINGHRYNLS